MRFRKASVVKGILVVENPASAVGADIANAAAEAGAPADRIEELARRGTEDPTVLRGEDVREICAALLSHLGKVGAR